MTSCICIATSRLSLSCRWRMTMRPPRDNALREIFFASCCIDNSVSSMLFKEWTFRDILYHRREEPHATDCMIFQISISILNRFHQSCCSRFDIYFWPIVAVMLRQAVFAHALWLLEYISRLAYTHIACNFKSKLITAYLLRLAKNK